METIKFQCEKCGNLLAVTTNLGGQQVRCPYCQHIVIAPAPLATTVVVPNPIPILPDDLSFSVSKEAQEQESIFAEGSEDIFGAPTQPHLELPPEPPIYIQVAPPVYPEPALPAPAPVAPPPVPPLQATVSEAASPLPAIQFLESTEAYGGIVLPGSPAADGADAPMQLQEGSADIAIGQLSDEATGPITSATSAALPRPVAATSRALLWVVVFLLPYSIFITAVAITYYLMYQNNPSPLEGLPDIFGDFKDTTKKGPRSYQMPAHDSALPDKLRVALGQPIQLGDLKAVAERIEQGRIIYKYRKQGHESQSARNESLVLHLRLSNTSDDVFFHPTDPYFDRRWIQGKDPWPPPYMFLEAGEKRYYGGAVHFQKRGDDSPREYVKGQEDNDQELKPGQQTTTVVCTAPEDDVPKKLASYRGKLLWRVQLRRGFVQVGNTDYPVTGVIGVEFTMNDVQR